jgi:hypothetical protein
MVVPFNFKLFLTLIRALFPRWNFFDFVGFDFQVSFKIPDQNHWEILSFEVNRKSLGLMLNPECNLNLAKVNVIEHFAQDIQSLKLELKQISKQDLLRKASYLMLVEMVKVELSKFEIDPSAFQFKVTAIQDSEEIDLFFSDWISMVKS